MNIKPRYIKVETKEQVLRIVLHRPKKKNALNPQMINEIQEALDLHKGNNIIKVILISSDSDVFCAGADIEYLKKIKTASYKENLLDSEKLMHLFKTMLLYPKLIISKISGAAVGGGCGIITASDITFATENSVFGYPEVRIGFVPALVTTFLINKINESNTRELLLTGNLINAKKAKEIGLINHICDEKKIDKKIDGFINDIIGNTSINSIAETKKMIYTWLDLEKKLKKAAEFNAKNRKTKDFKKGVTSFLMKRKINWGNE